MPAATPTPNPPQPQPWPPQWPWPQADAEVGESATAPRAAVAARTKAILRNIRSLLAVLDVFFIILRIGRSRPRLGSCASVRPTLSLITAHPPAVAGVSVWFTLNGINRTSAAILELAQVPCPRHHAANWEAGGGTDACSHLDRDLGSRWGGGGCGLGVGGTQARGGICGQEPQRHTGRCRTRDRGRRVQFNGSGRAGVAAGRLHPRVDFARVSPGA